MNRSDENPILTIRAQTGLSQIDFGLRLGFGKAIIGRFEKHESTPSLNFLNALLDDGVHPREVIKVIRYFAEANGPKINR